MDAKEKKRAEGGVRLADDADDVVFVNSAQPPSLAD